MIELSPSDAAIKLAARSILDANNSKEFEIAERVLYAMLNHRETHRNLELLKLMRKS